MIPLETVPDSEKDWHPGSDGLVLNLVHPSLYPIVFGRTMGKVFGLDPATILNPPEFEGADSRFVSRRFQWLPSDFSVDGDGRVTLISPYINNIHPVRHKELHSVIPEILQLALPMFERVLSDLLRPLLPIRISTSDGRGRRYHNVADCIWEDGAPTPGFRSEREYQSDPDKWHTKYLPKIPYPKKYCGDLKVIGSLVSLKGRTLQVIVKLANILLTPDRPNYPGGRWHVEGLSPSSPLQRGESLNLSPQGMRNEMIVSSFIYVRFQISCEHSKI